MTLSLQCSVIRTVPPARCQRFAARARAPQRRGPPALTRIRTALGMAMCRGGATAVPRMRRRRPTDALGPGSPTAPRARACLLAIGGSESRCNFHDVQLTGGLMNAFCDWNLKGDNVWGLLYSTRDPSNRKRQNGIPPLALCTAGPGRHRGRDWPQCLEPFW